VLPPAGDDHLIAERVKGFCKAAADAGAASSDEDGVAGEIHGVRASTGS
jgi:hypothetical protein